MNKQQISDWIRTTLAVSGPIAALIIDKTGLSTEEYALYLQAALVILPGLIAGGIGWYRNRADVQIKTAKDLPCVAAIVVKDGTNGSIGEMAANPNVPKVVFESQNVTNVQAGKP